MMENTNDNPPSISTTRFNHRKQSNTTPRDNKHDILEIRDNITRPKQSGTFKYCFTKPSCDPQKLMPSNTKQLLDWYQNQYSNKANLRLINDQ